MKLNVTPQKTVLARSDEQIVYEVSSHEWAHLKHLVDIISIIEPIHQNLATLFFGISITALFSAIQLPEDVIIMGNPGKLVFYSIFGIFLISCVPCVIYAYLLRDSIRSSKENVSDYMGCLEGKFGDISGCSEEES